MHQRQQIVAVDWRPCHAVLFAALWIFAAYVPMFRTWPLLWIVPLAAYGLLVVLLPALRRTFRWWGMGKATPAATIATLAIAAGSCAVLISFDVLARPDVSEYGNFLPIAKLGGLWTAGVVFALANAIFEEVVYRGILFDAIASQLGDRVAIVATAGLFGYSHMHGYPPGPIGIVFAGIYGLCMGWLRQFSGGLGLPVVAHIAADATIYILIARTGVLAE